MWNQYSSLHKYVIHIAGKSGWTPIEHAILYSILHTRKDGFAVNPVVQAKMVSNPFVVSFSLSIIAFAPIEWFHNNIICFFTLQ